MATYNIGNTTFSDNANAFTVVMVANSLGGISSSGSIAPVGSAGFNTGQATVGSTATLIAAARTGAPGTGRLNLTIVNTTGANVYLGNSSVNTSIGQFLVGIAGASVTMSTMAAVYGVVVSGSSLVTYQELY